MLVATATHLLPRLLIRWGWSVLFWSGLAAIAPASHASDTAPSTDIVDPALPVLRTMRQLWDMPTERKDKPHRVSLELHVTYYDPQWKLLWVLDGDTPAFVPLGTSLPDMETGDLIRVEGVYRPVDAFALSDFSVEVIEKDRPFTPIQANDKIENAYRLNIQLVRIEALVEAQYETDPTHLELHMIVAGHRVRGRLQVPAGAPAPLLAGQVVTADGVFAPESDTNAEFHAQFWIGRESQIHNATPLNEYPDFSRPQTMISQVGNSNATGPVRLVGRIVHLAPHSGLSLEDPTGTIRVSTAQTLGISSGATVEICGEPVPTREGWMVGNALVRATTATETKRDRNERVAVPPEELPLLDSLQAYWNVEASRKDMLHRFSFVLHVTYFDPDWGLLWFENGRDFSFINVDRKDVLLHTGQVVRIEGMTRPSDPVVLSAASTITTLAEYEPIQPVDVTGKLDHASDYNARTVRLTGLVERQQEVDATHAMLLLMVDGHRVEARSRLTNSDVILDLAGHLISVEGVLIPRASSDTLITADLWIGRMGSIRPLNRLEDDPLFNVEPTEIDALSAAPEDRLVKIVGTLYALNPDKDLVVRDATGQVRIATTQSRGLHPDGLVEVRGYPRKVGSDWTLVRPLARMARGERAASAPGSMQPTVIYRMADQVISLAPETAQAGAEVKIRGIVLWSHPQHASFFVRDASGGIEVERSQMDTPPPVPGTAVVITGTTSLGAFAPTVIARDVPVLGSDTIPDARLVTLEQAMTGIEEAQRIAIRGYVRSVTHHEWTTLELFSSGGDFVARAPLDRGLDAMKGALVEVSGTCVALANARRQLTGIQLWLNGPADIKELQPAPREAFEGELRQVATLRQFGGRHAFGSRIRVRGTVLLQLPGRYVIVNDGSGGIVAHTRDTSVLQPGDAAEVAGLAGFDGPRTVLREASVRPTGGHDELAPVLLSTDLINEDFDATLVRLDATVLDVTRVDHALRLNMIHAGTTFEALLDEEESTPRLERLRPGSELRVTGVYRLAYDEKHEPDRFSLLLRSAGDAQVLNVPSWFTVTHAKWLAGGLAVIIGLAFAWAYSLRKRVQHQTGQIREQLVKEARLEDRQRNIIEKASDFIFMLDLSGRFTLFNPAGEAVTGYRKSDTGALAIFDLITEADRPAMRNALDHARPGGEMQPIQTQFVRKNGTLVWVEVAARFLAEDDRVTGVLCVARDITERKRVEEELKRARDAAEANTRAKSAFLANMSHEIRTPMNGVIGMSNLLLDTPLSHDQRDFAVTIRNSAEALLTVLNDILDFSKIEAGKLQFETLDFDLTETVDDTLDLLAARAASKNLELAALVPSSLPQKLRGDPGRLRQILLNLVGNAIKFTDTGDVSVVVRLERESADDVCLRFEVRDTGIGMKSDEQEKLFVPFSQADASTTRRYGGTGLGLAICRQIIDQMNGRIGVRSSPGQGSTFWFTLSFQRGGAAPLDPPPESLRGRRILGVDDNATNRSVLQHYLEPSGVRLQLAGSAHEALAMLRAAAAQGDPFQLALLDFHMPDMDGLALARAIQADATLTGVSTALLTSVDRRFGVEELREIGIGASLAKPIRRRELMHAIQRALNATPVEHAPVTSAATAAPSEDMPPLRVLVAEDNPVNQRLTRIQLKKLGYEADLACNGNEVLEAFERVSYDVIFMDCQMPELDGYDTARRLGSHPRRGEVRIIAMTANAMQGDRDKCIEAGMDDYLSKPTRPEDLAAALRRASEAITRPA